MTATKNRCNAFRRIITSLSDYCSGQSILLWCPEEGARNEKDANAASDRARHPPCSASGSRRRESVKKLHGYPHHRGEGLAGYDNGRGNEGLECPRRTD